MAVVDFEPPRSVGGGRRRVNPGQSRDGVAVIRAHGEISHLRTYKMSIKSGHIGFEGTMQLKTVSAAEFKARCLALLEEVRRTRQPLLVTRHGKPVAEISPHGQAEDANTNPLKGSVLSQGDLVSPIDVSWDGSR
jgi:prevent-host-death family protein